jgi:DNA-binding response OmpR family regulator
MGLSTGLALPARREAAFPFAPALTAGASARRVVVADDQERVRVQLASALSATGCTVETVGSARALVESVLEAPTHLVALSTDLPDIDPPTVVERMQRLCSVPPVVLIASHGADPRRGPLGQSAAACLFKPVDGARFVGTCQRVLRFSERRVTWETRSEPRRPVGVDVAVEPACGPVVTATLVNLSPSGFQVELPDAAELGRPMRVTVAIPDSTQVLTFEGRLEWQRQMGGGTLAGGSLLHVGPEDQRILEALLHPLG